MQSTVVVSVVFTLFLEGCCNLCVLEPMATISKPLCVDKKSCRNDSTRWKRETYSYNDIPLVPLGSPSSGHFQSVEGNFPIYDRVYLEANDTSCDVNSSYRTIDGSCNNLRHTTWGQSYTPFLRILYPRYSNNESGLPLAVSGSALPLPRVISTTILTDVDYPWQNNTLITMQWGQLLAHDVGLSPSSSQLPIDCCADPDNSQCCPIQIPTDDLFYSQYNQTCISLIRTEIELQTYNCQNIAYQVNGVSHYIDMSFLYGSDIENESSLRQFEGGLLEVHRTVDMRQFPKLSDNPSYDCSSTNPNITCFHSGDRRVNQNTELTSIQTVLLREHNRIATELASVNPGWDDEILYQESRRILIAVFQHVSYKEWLPLIVGQDYMKTYNLNPVESGFTGYDSNMNVGTINSFMASIYRTFHSLIQGKLEMYKQKSCPFKDMFATTDRCPFKHINISDYMNRPGIVLPKHYLDGFLLGLTVQRSQKLDRYFTTQMTDLMFHGDYPYGEDLASIDIQRGRDHGLPCYNKYRELCGLKVAENFTDFSNEISDENIELLQQVYENVNDVDLYVGSVLENWVSGTSVGPTALCIVGEQFVRKKFADRFWYEVGDQIHSFTEAQLQEIKKVTLSRLICDNSDNITNMQPNAFFSSEDIGNELVDCNTLPSMNLHVWKT